jgi:ribonuclease D
MKKSLLPCNDSKVHRRFGDLNEEDLRLLQEGSVCACDIETTGLVPSEALIGTVQLHDALENAWLIQVDQNSYPENLGRLLTNTKVLKVFHHAPFDLGFMRYHWGVHARNVACTKVLSRLTSPNKTRHSLKDLLQRELDYEIPKGEAVRLSDWTARDLSETQVRYAISDVKPLLTLYSVLNAKATENGLADIVKQTFNYLPTRVETDLIGVGDIFAY